MKKYSIVLIAVAFALGSAFTFKPAFATFQFNGSSIDPDHRVDPNQYSLASPSCGSTETTLCSIDAANNGNGKPVIAVDSDLYDALENNDLPAPDFSPAYITGKNP